MGCMFCNVIVLRIPCLVNDRPPPRHFKSYRGSHPKGQIKDTTDKRHQRADVKLVTGSLVPYASELFICISGHHRLLLQGFYDILSSSADY